MQANAARRQRLLQRREEIGAVQRREVDERRGRAFAVRVARAFVRHGE